MSAQSVPVPDTTSEEEFDLFGLEPASSIAPAASSGTASTNPFVSEEQASASALSKIGRFLSQFNST